MRWIKGIWKLTKGNQTPLQLNNSSNTKALAEGCKKNASIDKSLFVCFCEKCKFMDIRAPSARKCGFTYKTTLK